MELIYRSSDYARKSRQSQVTGNKTAVDTGSLLTNPNAQFGANKLLPSLNLQKNRTGNASVFRTQVDSNYNYSSYDSSQPVPEYPKEQHQKKTHHI